MSEHPADQSSIPEIPGVADEALSLDKQTLKDLEAPPGAELEGGLGIIYSVDQRCTVTCPVQFGIIRV